MDILVWGAGAIGGTAGAYWSKAGVPVTLVDANPEHVRAIASDGLRVHGARGDERFRLPVYSVDEIGGRHRCVVLAVKSDQTEVAARAIARILDTDGFVVSFQNGLNEIVLSEVLGRERTVGAFVNWSAEFMEPGVLWYGGKGALVVGELDGRVTDRLKRLHELCRLFLPEAEMSDDIMSYLWSKLIYGSFLRISALADMAIVDALRDPACRQRCVALAREIIAVADRHGIRLHSFNGFDPDALRPSRSPAALDDMFERLAAFNATSAITHASVWRDLTVRRRRTDTRAQFAPLRRVAAGHGVPTPTLDRLVAAIEAIEAGEVTIGAAALATV